MAPTLASDRWPLVGRRAELEVFERVIAAEDRAGLVIHGQAGVGKTRLADECREWAAAGGYPTERVVGTRTAASLPLGAVVALLAGITTVIRPGEEHTVALFEHAHTALLERHGGRRAVIVADDIALLDAASVALLGYLAERNAIFLVATVRAREPVPDLVAGLWKDGRLERVDLEDLSQTQFDTLLHLALGGPIEAGAGRQLWGVSGGNPLYARELVLGAVDLGALVERAGVWHLDGSLPTTNRLRDLIEQRISGLPEDALALVERLALCEPLPLADVEARGVAPVLEFLERAGLVNVTVDEGDVRLAHPLHAEVVRAAMPRSRARTILLAEADRLEADAPAANAAALRIAQWRLDAGGQPDPAILVRGAHLARYAHDFRAVRRLMAAVPLSEIDAVGALLCGEALYELGDFDAAEKILAHGHDLPSDDDIAVQLAVTRAKNLNWGLCQPDAALAVIADARGREGAKPWREELLADEASVQMFSGHPYRALAVLDDIRGDDRRTRVVRAIVAAPALAATGRTADGIAAAETGFAEHVALGDQLAIAHPATHVVNRVFALTEAGDLQQAEHLARAGLDAAASYRVPIAQIWFAANLARVATLQGRFATARRYYAEADGLAQANHFVGPRRLALSGLALASAVLGQGEAAQQALSTRDALPAFGFLGPEQYLADAWTAITTKQPKVARQLFEAAADEAAASGHRIAEAALLHDLFRATGARVADRLDQVASHCDSALVAARARHASATQARDVSELSRAADDFEKLGAMLLAAEAAAGAADAARRAGDTRAATAASRRSSALAACCEGVTSPSLIEVDAVVPLSRREREIVLLAADGLGSKDIADRLFVSIRTVNNHLQHAYTKLGVTSRAELARTLGRNQ
jgi:DNA-binding CsgD family transcriptional regulator